MLSFYRVRAIAGVERVHHTAYERSFALEGAQGRLRVRDGNGDTLELRVEITEARALPRVVARVQRMFDLHVDPAVIAAHLEQDPRLAPLVAARPGLRVPGAWDPFETALRAILGQQVSVGHITIGGTVSSVAFMAGLSNDFRVQFDVSTADYSVAAVTENLSFVTTVDAFYSASQTDVEQIAVSIQPDADLDNVLDSSDNCQIAANTSQQDTDSDGIGSACDADFNQDCNVNAADLGIMRANCLAVGDVVTDLNGDGVTNPGDLAMVKALFLLTPGPSGLPNACAP